jgi:hypothetical protein
MTMSKFLVTYIGGGLPQEPELMAQAKAAFEQWLDSAGAAVIDPGAPVATVSRVAAGEPADEAAVNGYSIIEAADSDAAIALLQTHPFVGRGGTLQLSEFVAV